MGRRFKSGNWLHSQSVVPQWVAEVGAAVDKAGVGAEVVEEVVTDEIEIRGPNDGVNAEVSTGGQQSASAIVTTKT